MNDKEFCRQVLSSAWALIKTTNVENIKTDAGGEWKRLLSNADALYKRYDHHPFAKTISMAIVHEFERIHNEQ